MQDKVPDAKGAEARQPQRQEKLMSLSRSEFVNSIKAFAGQDAALQADGQGLVQLPVGQGGTAEITYVALPGATLGGLLKLPRAQVSIAFDGCSSEERAAFMRRFDTSFQRGGG